MSETPTHAGKITERDKTYLWEITFICDVYFYVLAKFILLATFGIADQFV